MAYMGIIDDVIQTGEDLSSIQQVDDIVLPASGTPGLPGTPVSFTYTVQQWDFLWLASSAISTGKFDFQIDLSGAGDRAITNDFVRSTLFWGNAAGSGAEGPTVRHCPKALPVNGQVKFTLRDLAGAGNNTVSLTLHGRKLSTNDTKNRNAYGKGQGLFLFTSPSGGQAIPQASGTTQFSMRNDNTAHLRISHVMAEAALAATPTVTQQSMKLLQQFRDPRFGTYNWGGQQYSRMAACSGSAASPYRPPCAPVLAKDCAATIYAVDTSGSVNNTLWVTYICRAIQSDVPAEWD
jgi:hypothetical protein